MPRKLSGGDSSHAAPTQLTRRGRGAPQFASCTAVDGTLTSTSFGSVLDTALHLLRAFVRFTRPHTIIGTVLSIVSVSLMAVSSPSEVTAQTLAGVVQAIVPALLMNVCIVGFNQVCDVEIDKVNKPYLPLANGDFSPALGLTLVVLSGAAALAMGVASNSQPLLLTLALSLGLGIVYSADLPLMRWKRSPVLAAACIFGVRALAVQLGFYFHMATSVLLREPVITFPLAFACTFMAVFSIVIAFFKDIPDVKGDRVSAIHTLSVRLGERAVLDICVALLLVAYAGAIVASMYTPNLLCRGILIGAHALMAVSLKQTASATNAGSNASITATYMHVWKLFYCEYLLLPLIGRL